MLPEELEKIIKSNQLSLARIEKQVEKISKKLLWNRIAGLLKIVLILAPIIFGVLYLTPKLKQIVGSENPFTNVLKVYTGGFDSLDSDTAKQEPTGSSDATVNDLKEAFCNPNTQQEAIRKICN